MKTQSALNNFAHSRSTQVLALIVVLLTFPIIFTNWAAWADRHAQARSWLWSQGGKHAAGQLAGAAKTGADRDLREATAPPLNLQLQSLATGLNVPVYATNARDSRLFIVEKGGRILIYQNESNGGRYRD